MSRRIPFPFKSARRRRALVKATTFGTAALACLAVISSGGSAMATPLIPAGSVGYQMNATGTGLLLDLFGTEITGAQTSTSASYVTDSSGNVTESASGTGEGIFLTSNVADSKVTASAASGGTTTDGSTTETCKQGGGSPAGTPITVALGLGCAAAQATVDPSSDGPQSYADAKVVHLTVDVSSILHQLASGGATQLCNGLSQIPTLGSQILGPACNQVLSSIAPTLDVTIGSAVSQITSTPDQLEAQSTSSSIDVKLFPAAATSEPLLEVTIPSAIATSIYTTAGGWANNYDATLIRVTGTIVDDLHTASGGAFPDPLEIPPNNSGTSQLQTLNSSPLGQLLTLDLASGTTSGNSVNAEGAKVTLLGGVAPGGGVVIDTSGVGTSETAASGSSTGCTSNCGQTASNQGTTPPATTPAPAPTFAAATSPTAVHTGEWWSGSLPLLALLAAIGGGLLGWPRIRRLPFVTRLVSRGNR